MNKFIQAVILQTVALVLFLIAFMKTTIAMISNILYDTPMPNDFFLNPALFILSFICFEVGLRLHKENLKKGLKEEFES